jgi:ankyrin repeat protein
MHLHFNFRIGFLIVLLSTPFIQSCTLDDLFEALDQKFNRRQTGYKAISIPTEKNRLTKKDVNRQYYLWIKRLTTDWYKETYKKSVSYSEDTYDFLGQVCKFMAIQPDRPKKKDLLESARVLSDTGNAIPFVRVFYGYFLYLDKQYEHAQEVLTKAIRDMKHMNRLHLHDYFAQVYMNKILLKKIVGKYSEQNLWEEKAAHSMVQAITSGEFAANEMQIAYHQILDKFSNDNKQLILDKLKAEQNIDPWLLKMIEGQNNIEYAWRMRGGGWGYEVTEDGWTEFRFYLKEAAKALIEAWRLHPDYPEAATNMITVAMGKCEASSESERCWFDRAVAAQMDYQNAYNNYLWSLCPRWGGSLMKMNKFALECLETERFDTDVPWFYLIAMRDMGKELPHNRWKSIFRKTDVRDNLNTLFEGMQSEPSRSVDIEKVIAQQGNVWLWGGRYEEARKLFASLKDNFDMSQIFSGRTISWNGRSMAVLQAEIDLFTGSHKQNMLQAESFNLEDCGVSATDFLKKLIPVLLKGNIGEAYQRYRELKQLCIQENVAKACELYKSVMESVKDYPIAYNYLREIIVSTMDDSIDFSVRKNQDPLHAAAIRNRPDMVRFLLETGSSADALDEYSKKTPLHRAAAKGNTEICRILLDNGANVNSLDINNQTPLFKALRQHRPDTANFLIDKGAKTDLVDLDNWTPLHLAIHGKHQEVALRILEMDVNINALNDQHWSPLCLAIRYDQPEVAWRLIKKGADINEATCDNTSTCFNASPLYFAIYYDQPEIATWLIKNNADIHTVTRDRGNALHAAIYKKNVTIAKLLVKYGADVNFLSAGNWSPLHRACKGLPEIASFLIERGADIHAQTSDGWTPFEIALWAGHTQIGAYLIEKGADINRANPNRGFTPLHLAAVLNDVALVQLLVDKGANLQAKDKDGKTPLDIAKEKGNLNVVKIIVEQLDKKYVIPTKIEGGIKKNQYRQKGFQPYTQALVCNSSCVR